MPVSNSALNLDDLIANLRGEYQQPNVVAPQITSYDRSKSIKPFFGNAFNASGTPTFDPLTGYFQGLDKGVPGQLSQPKAYKSNPTEVGLRSVTRGLTQTFPQLVNLFNSQILPNELAQLQSSLITSPEYANLQRDIYSGNAAAAAESDKNILLGPGADIISIADRLQRQVDPEYYQTRSDTAAGIQDLLKPGLSRGEEVSIERSLNRNNGQQGNLNTPSNLSTVSNAMTYGGAARDRLSSAINQATQFLPNARSGVDVLQQGIKSPSSVSSAFSNARQNSGQDVFGSGNNAFSQGSGMFNNNQSNANALKIAKLGVPSSAEKILSAMPDY